MVYIIVRNSFFIKCKKKKKLKYFYDLFVVQETNNLSLPKEENKHEVAAVQQNKNITCLVVDEDEYDTDIETDGKFKWKTIYNIIYLMNVFKQLRSILKLFKQLFILTGNLIFKFLWTFE